MHVDGAAAVCEPIRGKLTWATAAVGRRPHAGRVHQAQIASRYALWSSPTQYRTIPLIAREERWTTRTRKQFPLLSDRIAFIRSSLPTQPRRESKYFVLPSDKLAESKHIFGAVRQLRQFCPFSAACKPS